jgi:hypothetical protein
LVSGIIPILVNKLLILQVGVRNISSGQVWGELTRLLGIGILFVLVYQWRLIVS